MKVRLKKEKDRQRKAEEDAQDAKEEMRIKAAIEAEQRAINKEAPAFSNFPDEASENVNNLNFGGGGKGGKTGGGGNRGRVANSPPPQRHPEPTLKPGPNQRGEGHDGSRRKLGYSEIPGLENHNPSGASAPSAPSTPPPPNNNNRARTPPARSAPRTPDPALRSMAGTSLSTRSTRFIRST